MKKRKPPNWRTRLTVVKSSVTTHWNKDAIKFDLEFDKKPKGFSKQQGHLILDPETPHKVKSAWVSRHFHHCNVGYTLYIHALKKLGTLSTDYNAASAKARKLWRRLMNDFEHRIEKNGKLTVYKKRIRVRKRK